MLIRRFFAFVISAFLLFSLPLNAANAASSWSISSAASSGASTVVNATKGGLKSAVAVAPSAGRLALKFARGANSIAIGYALLNMGFGALDWVMDEKNNRVRVKNPSKFSYNVGIAGSDLYAEGDDMETVCKSYAYQYAVKYNSGAYSYRYKLWAIDANNSGRWFCYMDRLKYSANNGEIKVDGNAGHAWEDIPLTDIANQTIASANSGHAPSQEITKADAIAAVVAGDYDNQLQAGAVPNGTADTSAAGSAAAAAGQAAADARAVADSRSKAAGAAANAAKDAARAAAEAAANAQDLINSGADESAIAAADAAAKAAGAAANAAKDAAKAAADAYASAASDAASRSLEAQKAARAAEVRADAAAKAAADALAGVSADASQAVKDAAQAAADAAAKTAADAKSVSDAAAKAAADAAKAAAEAAKSESKPFELPAFCTWAVPVCDFIDWFKGDVPEDDSPRDVPFATTGDIGLDDVDRFEKRIDFSGQCPVNDFSFTMMGVTYAKPIPYYHLCGFLEQIAPWLLAMCYLGVAYFVVENI